MDGNDQRDECLDNMAGDDASIEILSEGGDSHTRDLEWSIYSAGRASIAGSDGSLMDFQKLSIHSKMATFVHHDGRQFIERRDLDDGGLPYSAEFYLNDALWKLSGEDCFLMSPRRYIAKVTVEGTVDLDGAVDFEESVRTLLKHLKVMKVLLDEQLEECNKAKSALKIVLDKLAEGSGENIEYKRDVMLLRILLRKHGNSLNMDFKHDLLNCSRLSSEIMTTFDNFVTTTLKLIQRNEFLGHMNDSSLSDEFIKEAVQKALDAHWTQLAAICPSSMQDKLTELPDDYILYVSTDDMNLFTDLKTLDQTLFESVLPMIFSKFLMRVQEMNDKQFSDFDSLTNRIFLYVCKSLQDVAEQFEALTETDNAIIYNEALGWEVVNLQEESPTPYSKCLSQQLEMLAMLANHFEPGGPFRTSHFPYEFKLFQNMDGIPEPVRIWLCLLDNCMNSLVPADMDKMQMLSCFFKSYVSFIASEDFRSKTLECLRTITHDALRSLTDANLPSEYHRPTSDPDLRDYNDLISSCLDKFLCEHFGTDCEQIQATLRQVFSQAMNKNATSEASTEFSYVFKQLLKDLSDLPLEWYLQLPPSENRNLLLRGQFVVPVDNRWKDTEHEYLKVVDPEGFVKMYKLLHNGEEIPKHYQLKVIQVLLDKLTAKQRCYEGKLRLDRHQLGTMTDMISSIRNSILYLNRQPDYSCFEDFLQQMGELFSHAIKMRSSLADFPNPTTPTNDSQGTDPPHTDPIDFSETLDLFEGSISKELLISGLKIYTTQFNKHITETIQLPRENRFKQIVSDVVLKVKPQLATAWTEEFKRNELPEVLAGLSAVWSVIVSKNGSSFEKLVKPSTLQISCILSYFEDLNHNDGDLYRLLYVSNQQGKELILGLTAALLALYGHKVLIACYNSNLALRNAIDLIELFKAFSINHNISYGSMEDMARERSRQMYEKYAANIHECLGTEMNARNRPYDTSDDRRSVLLIDDIKLLLQSRTLGQAFKRFVRPTIPGLGLLQEKMLCPNDQLKESEINHLILKSDDPHISKARAFQHRPQSYTILEGRSFEEKEYTNKTLFYQHLDILKRYSNISHLLNRNLRLSSNGVMTVRSLDQYDVHDTKNDINYFTLKESDFQQTVNGYKNYGFLTLGYIPFPFAHLLKSYPLVLGFVSAPLNGYEELTLNDHYGIYHKIAKSNPLATMSTKFNYKEDFQCNEDLELMVAVMVAINGAIDRNCSVLVFFRSEQEMEAFQNEFALHLKRLSVTAIETASNKENFTENEIAVDEVTVLAIEAVERNKKCPQHRQVHVIQTFFSDDGIEEDLIRRQAERSHGSGSYELIVSNRNLPRRGPYPNDQYDSLYEWYTQFRGNQSFGDVKECLTKNMEDYRKIEMYCEKF